MSIIDTLITDRTTQDVQEWEQLRSKGFSSMSDEERRLWLAGTKGSYTPYIDMNRVGEALIYISSLLEHYGYQPAGLCPKTDWKNGDVPTRAQLDDYLDAVKKVRDVLTVKNDTPQVPESMEFLSADGANAIERILIDIDTLIKNMTAAWYYSGEIYTGEV